MKTVKICLEKDPNHTVSIVIPDLAHRQAQVQELARDVFYPCESPLSLQQRKSVYGFSLGQPLLDLPAIDAAISVMALLKCLDYFAQRDQKIETKLLTTLQQLVKKRQALQHRLTAKKESSDFAALRFTDWVQVFSDWLELWHWRTTTHGSQMNSVQYQLQTRWHKLLEEFASLAAVQKRAGLIRALELLQQMARNTVFSPKGADSPILISGVFEAIGREVDTCIVTGMHQVFCLMQAIQKRLLNLVFYTQKM